LDELGCGDIPRVVVYNKIDAVPDTAAASEVSSDGQLRHVYISAAESRGIDLLLRQIADCLSRSVATVRLLLPYTAGSLTDTLRKEGSVLEEEYTADGVRIRASVPRRSLFRYQPYLIENLLGE
jgi:GTP-binding protein HflX